MSTSNSILPQDTSILWIRDVDNHHVWDESDYTFQIQGAVTLHSPNGEETWYVDDKQAIEWVPAGTYSQLKLEYSTNGFVNEEQAHHIATVSAGTSGNKQSYGWVIPDIIGSRLKVRVSDPHNHQVVDASDDFFSIKGKLKLINRIII